MVEAWNDSWTTQVIDSAALDSKFDMSVAAAACLDWAEDAAAVTAASFRKAF